MRESYHAGILIGSAISEVAEIIGHNAARVGPRALAFLDGVFGLEIDNPNADIVAPNIEPESYEIGRLFRQNAEALPDRLKDFSQGLANGMHGIEARHGTSAARDFAELSGDSRQEEVFELGTLVGQNVAALPDRGAAFLKGLASGREGFADTLGYQTAVGLAELPPSDPYAAKAFEIGEIAGRHVGPIEVGLGAYSAERSVVIDEFDKARTPEPTGPDLIPGPSALAARMPQPGGMQ
jgi:hypothetical protein